MMTVKYILIATACLMLTGCCLLPDREYQYNSPYGYSYTMYGTWEMTPLKPGNTEACREFFRQVDIVSRPVLPIPTNATAVGQFILIHGNDLRVLPIYKWQADDGPSWFAIAPIGYSPQFKAHSYRDFMSEIEKRLGNGYESVTPPRGQK